ncbi:MAG TPA: 3-hydroxyacyl-CoA dehydrogenase NAD-binding domain-containing protein [Steroidobacteraceae bacterium]|jgi:3-hydroxyacyl-CoA dehydrogenase/enoyl-CoA hydratase/3-hydroxybutyryl-CoA epimerase|nr:3-hydroxyacyl-CoA dehydrogenase NAD-binding domain-containing protein [Steroidobacteraceae bacterium]
MNDASARSWKLERDADGIAWLTLDKPGTSANVLSSGVLMELDGLLGALEQDRPRGAVLLSAKKSGFVAGADIKEFTGLADEASGYQLIHRGQQVLNRLAALPLPTVAAIHGFALGGGLELALACRYRVAVGDERLSLGLPEVLLGIHPGFGGTVRSVQVAGVRPAMEMMLTGKPLRAEKARAAGLIDRLVAESELRSAARELVLRPAAPHRAPLGERLLSTAPLRPFVRRSLIAQVAKRAPREHYPAPYAIIDLWARYGAHGSAAFEAEARSIAHLFTTETSRNLVRVFLLQDALKSAGSKGGADIRHVHVVGAGVMGGDIAAWSALRGFTVTLEDRAAEYVEPALKRAQELFDKRLRDPAKSAAARARLRADVPGDGVASADLVIEAIFENLAAKQELYARLEPRMKPTALLATNTSSIMLEPLAERLAHPERLVGLHFFNPVPQMPLIEIVHAQRTAPAAVQTATAFARRLDKLPVPCRSAPGFMVNRVLTPYLYEAMLSAQEGTPLALIDRCAVSFGMPLGPIELIDVVGLDVASHVGEIIAQELGRPVTQIARLNELLAAKKFGRKSGAGFYLWRDGKAVKTPAEGSAPPDLTDRLILVMMNECVACLRERVVESEDLVDAAVLFGTGFAPFRGGPLTYARARGVAAVVARLKELAQRYGERFRPDAGWVSLVGDQKRDGA